MLSHLMEFSLIGEYSYLLKGWLLEVQVLNPELSGLCRFSHLSSNLPRLRASSNVMVIVFPYVQNDDNNIDPVGLG